MVYVTYKGSPSEHRFIIPDTQNCLSSSSYPVFASSALPGAFVGARGVVGVSARFARFLVGFRGFGGGLVVFGGWWGLGGDCYFVGNRVRGCPPNPLPYALPLPTTQLKRTDNSHYQNVLYKGPLRAKPEGYIIHMEKKGKARKRTNTCYVCRQACVGLRCKTCYLRRSNKGKYARSYVINKQYINTTERIGVEREAEEVGFHKKIWNKWRI